MTDAKKPKPRTGPTSFKPGVSGNPGGRSPRVGPNGETAAQLARAHTRTAIDALVRVVKNDSHPQQVAAANALLNRGWGAPKDEDAGDKPDLAAVLADLIAKLPS